jgi:pimeloyl-ACP methyl ester carboxylesterase
MPRADREPDVSPRPAAVRQPRPLFARSAVPRARQRIPVLVIHGDQDRVLPYEATSSRLPALLKNARSTIIAGGPHAIIWTHADEVSQALLDFIGHLSRAGRRQSGPENPPQSRPQNGRAG